MGFLDSIFGGGSSDPVQSTTTTQSVFFPGQQEAITNILSKINPTFFGRNLKYYPGRTTPQASSATREAQDSVLAYARGAGRDMVNSSLGASNFLTSGDVLSPDSNPALAASIEGAINPVFRNLTQRVLPTTRSEFLGTGGTGSTRQGIAEGIATRDATRDAFDIASQMASTNYQAGLEAMTKGLALAPNTYNLGLGPAQSIGAVGQQREGYTRERMQENFARYMFNKFAPMQFLMDAANLAYGAPTMGTTSIGVAPGPQEPGLLSRLAGGAMMGSSLGGMFGMGGPMSATIGALLSI